MESRFAPRVAWCPWPLDPRPSTVGGGESAPPHPIRPVVLIARSASVVEGVAVRYVWSKPHALGASRRARRDAEGDFAASARLVDAGTVRRCEWFWYGRATLFWGGVVLQSNPPHYGRKRENTELYTRNFSKKPLIPSYIRGIYALRGISEAKNQKYRVIHAVFSSNYLKNQKFRVYNAEFQRSQG